MIDFVTSLGSSPRSKIRFILCFDLWQVRVVNFNVYMGYDRRGEDNTFRVADLLNQLEADVAAVQVRKGCKYTVSRCDFFDDFVGDCSRTRSECFVSAPTRPLGR